MSFIAAGAFIGGVILDCGKAVFGVGWTVISGFVGCRFEVEDLVVLAHGGIRCIGRAIIILAKHADRAEITATVV
jgi:hypothetical protein